MINTNNIIHHSHSVVDFFDSYMQTLTTPTFISRIGGSDFEIVCDYYNDKNVINNDDWYRKSVRKVKELNGYFDFNNDKLCFQQYLENMITYYISSDVIGYAGKQEKHIKFLLKGKSKYDPTYESFVSLISANKILFNWNQFIQPVTPFLKSFKSWGHGKTILIMSPFSKSIEYQYARKDMLFNNYRYPDFTLKTYNTPITYNCDLDSNSNLNIETQDWHAACNKMALDIQDIEFDIALLSCGSYAMFLGNYIKTTMHKHAIYFGGSLNLYFNIYGQRFDKLYSSIGLNPDYLITALENSDVEKIHGGRVYENESLNAYFGTKPND